MNDQKFKRMLSQNIRGLQGRVVHNALQGIFGMAQIDKSMPNVDLNVLSRHKKTEGRIAVRGVSIAAQSVPVLSNKTTATAAAEKGITVTTAPRPSPVERNIVEDDSNSG